ncbi:cyclic GMP-AMP synthase-like receptor [Diorhabda sublineata]|uniref:cyclic GMP-AMP synthase-like receptor n=1 Tax=Diorhabda sublineata TaxID=1163346 RepID=UPI0024E0B975|nr:cyclic GMP-AMP synthase-like receptor [Diorhabda sublineata]
MATDPHTKYKTMENVLQKINNKFIALPEEETKRNTIILDKVTEQLIEKMKDGNVLFNKMFQKIFYGGSYYDKLKVGKPEEYDLDFLLTFPENGEPTIEVSDKPGFVNVVINNYRDISSTNINEKKCDKYESLLVETKYLSTLEVLKWFERVLDKALKEFLKVEGEGHLFKVKLNVEDELDVYGTLVKAFPAFTLKLKSKDIKLDLDLVPCFQFTDTDWPKGNYKPNPFPQKKTFLVVPKSPKCEGEQIKGIVKYWRLSFQEQERLILTGDQYNNMKAVLRLLKKLRDQKNHKIASYYIKTMFLWEVDTREPAFWSQSLSVVFMEMLRKYEELLRIKNIPYYWNTDYNLIAHLKEVTIIGIANFIKKVIENVDRRITEDAFVIATYILCEEDVNELKKEVDIGKKNKKLIGTQSSSLVDTVEKSEHLEKIMESLDSLHQKLDRLINWNIDLEGKIKQIDEKVENLSRRLFTVERSIEIDSFSNRSWIYL